MRKPQPTKAHRVVTWFLVYRVPVLEPVTEAAELAACKRVKLPWEAWQAAKSQFPQLMARVEEKRARRRLWQECFGTIPDGWTPPDPNRPQSENFPGAALARWRSKDGGKFFSAHWVEWMDRQELEERVIDKEMDAPAEKQAVWSRAMQRVKTSV